jgi:hypothetical protein
MVYILNSESNYNFFLAKASPKFEKINSLFGSKTGFVGKNQFSAHLFSWID